MPWLMAWLLLSLWLVDAQPRESLYELVDIPNCSQLGVWNHEVPVLAGQLGFYGSQGDGVPGPLSRFRLPRAVVLDNQRLFISDAANHALRQLSLDVTGNLTTLAGALGVPGHVDGPLLEARFRDPNGLALDPLRGLYVADEGNHVVRLVDLNSRKVSTITEAGALSSPAGLVLSLNGLFISDAGHQQVQRLDFETSNLSVVLKGFQKPRGLAYDVQMDRLYVADGEAHAVYVLNASAQDDEEPLVVAGVPFVAGGPGDGSSFLHKATRSLLRSPDGLALDVTAQRLYVGDATEAIRVIDLQRDLLTLAAVRSSFGSYGPIGLALDNISVPGFKVDSIWHRPLVGGPPQFGNYFYFQSSKGYAGGFKNATGILRSRHYRRGVLLWVGYIKFFGERYGIGPTPQSSPELDNTGVRYPPPVSAEGQFEINDTILVSELLGPEEEARQMLYIAEGNSYTVRSVDLGAPANSSCGANNVTGLPESLWDMVPVEAGGAFAS